MSYHAVVVSTYPPRRCGLASFAQELRATLPTAAPTWSCDVCAIGTAGSDHDPAVPYTIDSDDPASYRRAAARIAAGGGDLVVIQHEFGIFGGQDGEHVLVLADELRRLRLPYVVTLHTVVARPSPRRRSILAALCGAAAAVTVFTGDARRLAVQTGVCDPATVAVVPHGAPAVLRDRGADHHLRPAIHDLLRRLDRSPLLATFGYVVPGKALEVAITALPAVLDRHPDTQYLIAGVTHPEGLRRFGERYRQVLAARADRLGVADHVHLLDLHATHEELAVLLARTDLYLTPYRSQQQSSSGPLTFALAAGRPVVSTDFAYAREMLGPGRYGSPGRLVRCGDSGALAATVSRLLTDTAELAATAAAADAFGATLTWPRVAARYAEIFTAAVTGRRTSGPDRHTTQDRHTTPDRRTTPGNAPSLSPAPTTPSHRSVRPDRTTRRHPEHRSTGDERSPIG